MIAHEAQTPSPTNVFHTEENPVVAKILANSKGHDFVIGDLHGALSSLEELMKEVKFNTSKDRILCVGDLTDRGPNSIECLELLKEPWFHSVLGNHDENTVKALEKHFQVPTEKLEEWDPWVFLMHNGGEWLCETAAKPENQRIFRSALENLRQLPHLLIVGDGPQRIHLVHAAAVKDHSKLKPLTDERIDKALNGSKPLKNIEGLNTFRELARLGIQNLEESPELNEKFKIFEGLSKTFCGHSTITTPFKIFSHIHIDTGAGKPDQKGKIRMLTAVEAQDPKEKIIAVRAGYPRIKLPPKKVIKNAIKTVKTHGKEAYENLEP